MVTDLRAWANLKLNFRCYIPGLDQLGKLKDLAFLSLECVHARAWPNPSGPSARVAREPWQ